MGLNDSERLLSICHNFTASIGTNINHFYQLYKCLLDVHHRLQPVVGRLHHFSKGHVHWGYGLCTLRVSRIYI